MSVRHRDILDVVGLDAKLDKLSSERLGTPPSERLRIGGVRRVGRSRIGDTGVPQEIALSMLDEIAVVDDVLRDVNVLPRRPARHVAGMSLAALENVKPLDTLALRKGCGCKSNCRERGSGADVHRFTPSQLRSGA